MAIKITFLKKENKRLRQFLDHEWEQIHPQYYGKKLDWNFWEPVEIRIKAEEKGKIIGGLVGRTMAGVFHISELIIDHSHRGLGVGETIMKEVEIFAKNNNIHFLYLETGEDWKSVKFYEKIGFKRAAKLNNFYDNKNFWLMTKYL